MTYERYVGHDLEGNGRATGLQEKYYPGIHMERLKVPDRMTGNRPKFRTGNFLGLGTRYSVFVIFRRPCRKMLKRP